jgi:hypothetical protein
MKLELQKEIYKKHNNILKRSRYKEGLQNAPYITRGIECEDGWFNLIDKTLTKIKVCCDRNWEQHPPIILQIKEKFGRLRIYFEPLKTKIVNDELWNIINAAEEESSKICEFCGEPAEIKKIKGFGEWLKCICDKCFKKKIKVDLDEDN